MQQLGFALRVIRYHLYSQKHNYKIVFLTLTEKSFNIVINTKNNFVISSRFFAKFMINQ